MVRYAGPLPFPAETLGDLWDMPEAIREEVERCQAETAAANRSYDDQSNALETALEQVAFATTLLDDLDTELQSATRLADFRKTFTRLVRESLFEGE